MLPFFIYGRHELLDFGHKHLKRVILTKDILTHGTTVWRLVMRLGPLEIILIIAVITAFAVMTRIFRTNRANAQQSRTSSKDTQIKPAQGRTGKTHNLLKKTSIAFTATGIILLLAGIGIFRWALQIYLWALILIFIGIVLMFQYRNK